MSDRAKAFNWCIKLNMTGKIKYQQINYFNKKNQ